MKYQVALVSSYLSMLPHQADDLRRFAGFSYAAWYHAAAEPCQKKSARHYYLVAHYAPIVSRKYWTYLDPLRENLSAAHRRVAFMVDWYAWHYCSRLRQRCYFSLRYPSMSRRLSCENLLLWQSYTELGLLHWTFPGSGWREASFKAFARASRVWRYASHLGRRIALSGPSSAISR